MWIDGNMITMGNEFMDHCYTDGSRSSKILGSSHHGHLNM
jgi:hypothetical protein